MCWVGSQWDTVVQLLLFGRKNSVSNSINSNCSLDEPWWLCHLHCEAFMFQLSLKSTELKNVALCPEALLHCNKCSFQGDGTVGATRSLDQSFCSPLSILGVGVFRQLGNSCLSNDSLWFLTGTKKAVSYRFPCLLARGRDSVAAVFNLLRWC